MKNKLLVTSLGLAGFATLMGIVSTTDIDNEREVLRAFHFGSTALFLGLMAVFTLLTAKIWKE
jgi:hypothetical protein